jgi:hypothetical protein
MSQPTWEFEDSTGVIRRGTMKTFTDYGGTDVTYHFICIETGRLHLISGSRLKNARRIWETS